MSKERSAFPGLWPELGQSKYRKLSNEVVSSRDAYFGVGSEVGRNSSKGKG
jgi:hypothetical protein